MQAQLHKESLVFHQRNRTWSAIYVFQRLEIDADTGRTTYRKDDDLGPDFVLMPVAERRLQTLTISRISRVLEIKGDPQKAAPAAARPPAALSDEQREKIRQRYFDNWIKQLP
jgi:hypothetical protein